LILPGGLNEGVQESTVSHRISQKSKAIPMLSLVILGIYLHLLQRFIDDLIFSRKKTLTDLWREEWEREFKKNEQDSAFNKEK